MHRIVYRWIPRLLFSADPLAIVAYPFHFLSPFYKENPARIVRG